MISSPKKVKKQEFKPEVVYEGVVREVKKETPMDLVNNAVKIETKGNWKKVTGEELVRLENSGLLIGYRQKTQEVLIKEN